MSEMLDFSLQVLEAIPEFLWSEPIRYIFGLVILTGVINIILMFKKGV